MEDARFIGCLTAHVQYIQHRCAGLDYLWRIDRQLADCCGECGHFGVVLRGALVKNQASINQNMHLWKPHGYWLAEPALECFNRVAGVLADLYVKLYKSLFINSSRHKMFIWV